MPEQLGVFPHVCGEANSARRKQLSRESSSQTPYLPARVNSTASEFDLNADNGRGSIEKDCFVRKPFQDGLIGDYEVQPLLGDCWIGTTCRRQ